MMKLSLKYLAATALFAVFAGRVAHAATPKVLFLSSAEAAAYPTYIVRARDKFKEAATAKGADFENMEGALDASTPALDVAKIKEADVVVIVTVYGAVDGAKFDVIKGLMEKADAKKTANLHHRLRRVRQLQHCGKLR